MDNSHDYRTLEINYNLTYPLSGSLLPQLLSLCTQSGIVLMAWDKGFVSQMTPVVALYQIHDSGNIEYVHIF